MTVLSFGLRGACWRDDLDPFRSRGVPQMPVASGRTPLSPALGWDRELSVNVYGEERALLARPPAVPERAGRAEKGWT